MNGVKTASRLAYREHVISGRAKYQREIVLEFMERHQLPRNRREISLLTGLPINVVTARVNALIENGDLIEQHFAVDPVTNQRVGYVEIPYKVIPVIPVVQGRMF